MPTYLFHLEKRNGDSACDVTHACFKKETEAKKKSWLGSWTRPGHCRSFYERTAVGELYEPLLSPRLTWRQNVYCSIVSQVWEGVISVLECVEAGDRSNQSWKSLFLKISLANGEYIHYFLIVRLSLSTRTEYLFGGRAFNLILRKFNKEKTINEFKILYMWIILITKNGTGTYKGRGNLFAFLGWKSLTHTFILPITIN